MDWRMRDFAMTVGLMVVYLAGAAMLALTVDRRFFLNDAVSITVWVLVGLLLALSGARLVRRG